MLPGRWTGTLRLSEEYFSTCHHITYKLDFHLSLDIPAEPSDDNPFSVQGTVHVQDPVVERLSCALNPDTYVEWTTHYIPSDYQIHFSGVRWAQGGPYMDVSGWRPLKAGTSDYKAYTHQQPDRLSDHRRDSYQGDDWPALLPVSDVSSTQFGVHADTWNPDSILLNGRPIGLRYSTQFSASESFYLSEQLLKAHFVLDGSFQRADSRKSGGTLPARWLAALLAFLGLMLTGAILNPSAGKFIAGLGGLVGLGEALGGIGLKTIAAQGRLGGFAGAAIVEGLALARTYQRGTNAGESASITAARLGISFGVDVTSFIAGAEIMGAAAGVVATATGFIGVVGAVAVGVGGAALLNYGVATVGDTVKNWANKKLSSFFSRNPSDDE